MKIVNKLISKYRITSMLLSGIMVATMFFSACDASRQANALNTLSKCKYELVGIDSLFLAGADINDMIKNRQLDISRLPGIAFSFLNQQLPLNASLQLEITNPTRNLAGIREFQYIIMIDDEEMIEGTSDLPIAVEGNSKAIVPVEINANVYKLVNNSNNLQKFLNLIDASNSQTIEPIQITFKIKPTISLAGKAIDYPGYINIRKTLDSNTLSRVRSEF